MAAKKNGILVQASFKRKSTATHRKNVSQVIHTANVQALYLVMMFQRSLIFVSSGIPIYVTSYNIHAR